jgi:pantoate--beta-alanine ligase
MGYLHEGHLSLAREARKRVGPNGKVVLSIYVNPTQFAPTEDLSRYPRDLNHATSRSVANSEWMSVFVPPDAEMYPGKAAGNYSTYVVEEALATRMEGASRPAHFRGVTTIVAKLFNIVQPDLAVFGQRIGNRPPSSSAWWPDLNFPLKIIVAPTVREADGVAMSSRNKYLVGPLRPQAVVLSRAIAAMRQAVTAAAKPLAAAKLKATVAKIVATAPDARLDYVEFFDAETLRPHKQVQRGTHMALAVFVGKTRLIDNGRL